MEAPWGIATRSSAREVYLARRADGRAHATAGAAVRHGSACVERHVAYVEGKIEVQYRPGCTGHDEPELDPVSSLPHSARDLTWKFVLPTDGKFPVAGTGFGFWFGGTVTDPNPKALFNQGFLEVQFYPDTLVSQCKGNGDSIFTFAKNTYTVCSPVWSIVGMYAPWFNTGHAAMRG